MSAAPQFLYRLLDADGRLLYVGITNDIGARLQQHAATKPWFDLVCTVQIERHPTREEVAEAERMAVRGEAPLHNIVRFRGNTPRRTVRVSDELWSAAAEVARERGEDLSAVARRVLERYVQTP